MIYASRDFAAVHQACQPTRGESYSSHLYEAALQTPKTPTTKITTSASVRFADLEEGEESTSDYASIEARSPGDRSSRRRRLAVRSKEQAISSHSHPVHDTRGSIWLLQPELPRTGGNGGSQSAAAVAGWKVRQDVE